MRNKGVVWEFFAGSRSFSKVAESKGYTTYTTDIQNFEGINQVCDIFDFDIKAALEITGRPNIIWFSPPCTSFSVASCYHHWEFDGRTYKPKSKGSELGLKIMHKINQIIDEVKPDYYIIENPRGLMRKMRAFKRHSRYTAWYCQYGHNTAKPTDLWANFTLDLKTCKNSNPDCHHERAPRGAYSGIQGVKKPKGSNYFRSVVPPKLCESIIEQIENPIKRWF